MTLDPMDYFFIGLLFAIPIQILTRDKVDDERAKQIRIKGALFAHVMTMFATSAFAIASLYGHVSVMAMAATIFLIALYAPIVVKLYNRRRVTV